MTDMTYFAQGGDAYRAWSEANCRPEMPENPHPSGTAEWKDWEQGFDDAMWWRLEGQYLPEEDDDAGD